MLRQLDIHLETNECWTFWVTPSTKFNFSRIADLNVKGKKIKFLGENLGVCVMTLEQAIIS